MKKLFSVLLSVLLFTTCGLETFYFLPQVSQTNITAKGNTEVSLNIPSLSEYATIGANYSIYYKIYMSGEQTDTQMTEEFPSIHPTLNSDYSSLYSYTNPANNSSVTTATTFSGLRYHEIYLEGVSNTSDIITSDGGSFIIRFPNFAGDSPYIENQGNSIRNNLLRTNEYTAEQMEPDRYFFYSQELIERTDRTNKINEDVALRYSGSTPILTDDIAYVSMYIVAVGQNPESFARIFGKPTHLGVYRLRTK